MQSTKAVQIHGPEGIPSLVQSRGRRGIDPTKTKYLAGIQS